MVFNPSPTSALILATFFVKIDDFDVKEDKYMAISLQYRGDVAAKSASEAVQQAKIDKRISLVEWVPTGFKVGLNQQPAASVYDDDVVQMDKNVVMMGNNIAIERVFTERITKKYDIMHSLPTIRCGGSGRCWRPAPFQHWYDVSHNHDYLFNARWGLQGLESDYWHLRAEQISDEEEESESES